MKKAFTIILAVIMVLTVRACVGIADSAMNPPLSDRGQSVTTSPAAAATEATVRATSAEGAQAQAEHVTKGMIHAIRAAYNREDWGLVVDLADEARAALVNHPEADQIAELREDALAQIKETGEAALAALNTAYDKVQKITWYKSKSEPKYIDTTCYIYPFIGRADDGETWLRVRLNYTGDSWVFYDNVIFSVDGENSTMKFSYWDITRDNDTDVWETTVFSPSDSDINLLVSIANSTETIIRFRGSDRYYDHTVTAKEKTAILEVLAAFEYLSTVPAGQ